MRVTLSSTTKLVELNGVPARIWEGTTESGIVVHCYITRIAVEEDEPRQHEFECELQSHRAPSSAVQAIDFRLLL